MAEKGGGFGVVFSWFRVDVVGESGGGDGDGGGIIGFVEEIGEGIGIGIGRAEMKRIEMWV